MFHSFRNPKIGQLEYTLIIDKYILRFNISMYNFVRMQIDKSFDQLYEPIHNKLLFQKLITLFIFLDIDRKISIWI